MLATAASRRHPSPGGSPADRGLDLHGLCGLRAGRADRQGRRRAGARLCRRRSRRTAPAPAAPPAAAPAGPTPGVAEKPETAKGQVEVVELTKLQQTVARRMAESKATAPHFYLQAEIDMTAAVEGRAKLKASAKEGDVVPTFNDMVVKACAIALREHPAGQRRLPRRQDRALLAHQRRRGGRRPGRARGPHRLRRRPEGAASDRRRDQGARRASPRRLDHSAGALRRDLHGLQPRHVRDLQLPSRDQHAAGRHPRGRRGEGEARGHRLRRRSRRAS